MGQTDRILYGQRSTSVAEHGQVGHEREHEAVAGRIRVWLRQQLFQPVRGGNPLAIVACAALVAVDRDLRDVAGKEVHHGSHGRLLAIDGFIARNVRAELQPGGLCFGRRSSARPD